MKTRKIRPMYAMTLAWHLTKALEENKFSEVSDKLREQLTERGMSLREATLKAPVILDGLDRSLQGELDFKQIRDDLCAERRRRDTGDPFTKPAVG